MDETEARILADEQQSVIEQNLAAFRENLLNKLTAATDPLTPKVAFKVLAYREALSWRTLEVAEGALRALQEENLLSSLILTRSLLECSAAYHFLHRKLRICVETDTVAELDATAMKLLFGARWEDWEYNNPSVLTMIDGANKDCPGLRKNYDSLSEYTHPNYSGVALAFSKHIDKFELVVGRYPRGTGRLAWTVTNSMIGALMLFEYYYNESANLLPKIIELCIRDLESRV